MIQITSLIPGMTYTEFLASSEIHPFRAFKTEIISATTGQLLQDFTITHRNAAGKRVDKRFPKLVDPYQWQTDRISDDYEYYFDGFSRVRIASVLASADIILNIYPAEEWVVEATEGRNVFNKDFPYSVRIVNTDSSNAVTNVDIGDAALYRGNPPGGTTYSGITLPYEYQTFANDAARTAATPLFIGQLGTQTDTGIVYRGTALTAGSWTAISVGGYDSSKEGLVVTNPDGDATDVLIVATRLGVGPYALTSVNVTADITASGANGLDTGSEASSTWYSVWVIYNPGSGTTASLLSANMTTPTMPSGYTHARRVGFVYNDASSNFDNFTVNNDTYIPTFDISAVNIFDGSPTTGSWQTIAIPDAQLPDGVVFVTLGTHMEGDGSANGSAQYHYRPTASVWGQDRETDMIAFETNTTQTSIGADVYQVFLNSSKQFDYYVFVSQTTVGVLTIALKDFKVPDLTYEA